MTLPPLGCPVSGKGSPRRHDAWPWRSVCCAVWGGSLRLSGPQFLCFKTRALVHVPGCVLLAQIPRSACSHTLLLPCGGCQHTEKGGFILKTRMLSPSGKTTWSGHRVAHVPTRPQRARAELLTSCGFVTRGPSTPKSWASLFLIWPLRILHLFKICFVEKSL